MAGAAAQSQSKKTPSSTPTNMPPRPLRDVLGAPEHAVKTSATALASATSSAHRSLVLSQLKEFIRKVFEKEMVTPLIFQDIVYEVRVLCFAVLLYTESMMGCVCKFQYATPLMFAVCAQANDRRFNHECMRRGGSNFGCVTSKVCCSNGVWSVVGPCGWG